MVTMKNEISLGNLLSIGAMIVSVALAYGVLTQRVSGLEDRLTRLEQEREKTDRKYDDIKDKLATMTGEQKVANLLIAQLTKQLEQYTNRDSSTSTSIPKR